MHNDRSRHTRRTTADDIEAEPAADYVEDRIVGAFLRCVVLGTRAITVTTDGGKVTLTGTVCSWVEAADAERAAWSVPGVKEVDNHLVVRGFTGEATHFG